MSGGTEVGYRQPQTTVEPPVGPFIRQSQAGRQQSYNTTGIAFGGLTNPPLVAKPGYYRGFRTTLSTTTSGNAATVAFAADAPYNAVQLVQLKDAFGNVIISAGGYEALFLIPLFSGAFGSPLSQTTSVADLPSYSLTSGAGATGGSFNFCSYLPFEFTKAYGVISAANNSVQPQLSWQCNSSGSVYSTAPTTVSTLTLNVDADFYWLPQSSSTAPPGLGSSRQWVVQQANPPIGSGAVATVQFPRLGGYLDTIIIIARDSTNARNDSVFPTSTGRLRLILDGVPIVDSSMQEIEDDMAIQFGVGSSGGPARPAGVIAFTRKTSLMQVQLGLLDTGETYLSTNPATLIELQGTPWGTFSNSPAILNVLAGQIVPSESLITGLPEV